MASESAVLGTPAIYINSLKVGYVEEQEKKYQLAYNFSDSNGALEKALELLRSEKKLNKFKKKRTILLDEKIDVTSFIVWFIENYPKSLNIIKKNSDYQYNFK